ncbi:MAG: dihydrodipicolinate synthase family protein, partial [Planctomycetota bacterium]|nr:dihydrodipicolinate synthase family protein [Planctomycetota bacterium]
NGRVPVLVGITDTAFVESIDLAHVAKDAAANAVVLSTPYYFPAGQTELTRYVEHVVAELPLPLMLYNMPSLTKVWFEIETLRTLSSLAEIVGVKDSGGDLDYFKQLVGLKQLRPDWTILIGPEHLLAEAVAMGGDGGVSGGANIYPEFFVSAFKAAERGDKESTFQLMERVIRLQEIYSVGKYPSRFIKATKCALSISGICRDDMAEPFNHFEAPERERVKAILTGLID